MPKNDAAKFQNNHLEITMRSQGHILKVKREYRFSKHAEATMYKSAFSLHSGMKSPDGLTAQKGYVKLNILLA